MGKIKGIFAISQFINFLVLHTVMPDVVNSIIDHGVGMFGRPRHMQRMMLSVSIITTLRYIPTLHYRKKATRQKNAAHMDSALMV